MSIKTTDVLERQRKALEVVSLLNQPKGAEGSREWLMSIPARPDYDPDLIIGASLADIPSLLEEYSELEQEDHGWQWIREKIQACCPELTIKPRLDELANTKYEVMGWMHVLCNYAQSANQCYLSIAIEQQKRADEAEKEVARLTAIINGDVSRRANPKKT